MFSLMDGRAYISRRQHVLWVDERPEQPHQLDGASQLGVGVTNHLLDDHVDQQDILEKGKNDDV